MKPPRIQIGRLEPVLLNIGKCLTLRFLLHRGRFHDSPGTDVSAFLVWGSRCQAPILNNSIFLPFFLILLILLFGPSGARLLEVSEVILERGPEVLDRLLR